MIENCSFQCDLFFAMTWDLLQFSTFQIIFAYTYLQPKQKHNKPEKKQQQIILRFNPLFKAEKQTRNKEMKNAIFLVCARAALCVLQISVLHAIQSLYRCYLARNGLTFPLFPPYRWLSSKQINNVYLFLCFFCGTYSCDFFAVFFPQVYEWVERV